LNLAGGSDSRDETVVVTGYRNKAIGFGSSVTGGQHNTAHGTDSAVHGGSGNAAHGGGSVVSGGHRRSVYDTMDWRAGGLLEDE
jgi:hypothetical protein